MIHALIESLIRYEIKHNIIGEADYSYVKNQIYYLLKLDVEQTSSYDEIDYPSEALEGILDYASEKGIIENNSIVMRDHFDTKIMNVFINTPTYMIEKFNFLYQKSSVAATNWYYDFMKRVNYIRMDRIDKNIHYYYDDKYGKFEITINLSKPEKDPRSIALALNATQSDYPKCQLCLENEGYPGNFVKDARDNHRIIPILLNGNKYFFQYSPYIYYNEHSIVLNEKHTNMVIDENTINNLIELTDIFDGYFFGSNSDIPIVGGSILTHDHYQGGRHNFPIMNAKTIKEYHKNNVVIETLYWPLTTIRVSGKDKEEVKKQAMKIINHFFTYDDIDNDILSSTNGNRHNAVTPIVCKKNEIYEIYVVLRNNRTTEKYPLGIFHPHEEIWPIKKENIGLIEVAGLAILPGRLKHELSLIEKKLLNKKMTMSEEEAIDKHDKWVKEFVSNRQINKDTLLSELYQEVGRIFVMGLEHAGIYKQTEKGQFGLDKFLKEALI